MGLGLCLSLALRPSRRRSRECQDTGSQSRGLALDALSCQHVQPAARETSPDRPPALPALGGSGGRGLSAGYRGSPKGVGGRCINIQGEITPVPRAGVGEPTPEPLPSPVVQGGHFTPASVFP